MWGGAQPSSFYKKPLVSFDVLCWCLMGFTTLENHEPVKAQCFAMVNAHGSPQTISFTKHELHGVGSFFTELGRNCSFIKRSNYLVIGRLYELSTLTE